MPALIPRPYCIPGKGARYQCANIFAHIQLQYFATIGSLTLRYLFTSPALTSLLTVSSTEDRQGILNSHDQIQSVMIYFLDVRFYWSQTSFMPVLPKHEKLCSIICQVNRFFWPEQRAQVGYFDERTQHPS